MSVDTAVQSAGEAFERLVKLLAAEVRVTHVLDRS